MKQTALEYVRSHPEIFLHYDEIKMHELATKIVTDAITLGGGAVTLDKISDCWVISAKKNWLIGANETSLDNLFTQLIPNPKAGTNASRSEVVLNAYSENIVLLGQFEKKTIKGKIDEGSLITIDAAYGGVYVLAFS